MYWCPNKIEMEKNDVQAICIKNRSCYYFNDN